MTRYECVRCGTPYDLSGEGCATCRGHTFALTEDDQEVDP